MEYNRKNIKIIVNEMKEKDISNKEKDKDNNIINNHNNIINNDNKTNKNINNDNKTNKNINDNNKTNKNIKIIKDVNTNIDNKNNDDNYENIDINLNNYRSIYKTLNNYENNVKLSFDKLEKSINMKDKQIKIITKEMKEISLEDNNGKSNEYNVLYSYLFDNNNTHFLIFNQLRNIYKSYIIANDIEIYEYSILKNINDKLWKLYYKTILSIKKIISNNNDKSELVELLIKYIVSTCEFYTDLSNSSYKSVIIYSNICLGDLTRYYLELSPNSNDLYKKSIAFYDNVLKVMPSSKCRVSLSLIINKLPLKVFQLACGFGIMNSLGEAFTGANENMFDLLTKCRKDLKSLTSKTNDIEIMEYNWLRILQCWYSKTDVDSLKTYNKEVINKLNEVFANITFDSLEVIYQSIMPFYYTTFLLSSTHILNIFKDTIETNQLVEEVIAFICDLTSAIFNALKKCLINRLSIQAATLFPIVASVIFLIGSCYGEQFYSSKKDLFIFKKLLLNRNTFACSSQLQNLGVSIQSLLNCSSTITKFFAKDLVENMILLSESLACDVGILNLHQFCNVKFLPLNQIFYFKTEKPNFKIYSGLFSFHLCQDIVKYFTSNILLECNNLDVPSAISFILDSDLLVTDIDLDEDVKEPELEKDSSEVTPGILQVVLPKKVVVPYKDNSSIRTPKRNDRLTKVEKKNQIYDKYLTPVTDLPSQFLSNQLIVLDAANICMRFKKGQVFAVEGLFLAMTWFLSRGHRVACFLPDHMCSYEDQARIRRIEKSQILDQPIAASKLVDDVSFLEKLKNELVFATPSQDYDDSYCISYARNHDGWVVSNDRFRDQFDKAPFDDRPRLVEFLTNQIISFAFVKDEFFPDPDTISSSRINVNIMHEYNHKINTSDLIRMQELNTKSLK